MLCFILWEVNIMSVNFKTKLQDIVNYHNKLIINWKKNILYEISLSDFNPLNLKLLLHINNAWILKKS